MITSWCFQENGSKRMRERRLQIIVFSLLAALVLRGERISVPISAISRLNFKQRLRQSYILAEYSQIPTLARTEQFLKVGPTSFKVRIVHSIEKKAIAWGVAKMDRMCCKWPLYPDGNFVEHFCKLDRKEKAITELPDGACDFKGPLMIILFASLRLMDRTLSEHLSLSLSLLSEN